MKIIFMGTPKPAADLLEVLIKAKADIVAVVTQPDKPKGRGLKMTQCETAEKAVQHGLKVIKPVKVKDPSFLEEISALKPDLVVVVAYGKILPKEFLDIPKFGCINVHASYLPKYRGASPIQTALLNGDKETGVTIFLLNEKMDEGDIVVQEKVQINENDNSQTLSDRLFEVGGRLLLNVINMEGANGIKQDHSQATYCKIIKKEDGRIDLNKPAKEIVNMIRALSPWPGAFARFNGKTVKIIKASVFADVMETEEEKRSIGEVCRIIKDEGFEVVTGKGTILVKEVKPENSKSMPAHAFISGYRLKVGDRFE